MMQPEVMRAIIEEAHRLSLKAYVHAPGMRQAKEVLRAGADGLVHSVTDAPLNDEFITLMKKNGATYTTTSLSQPHFFRAGVFYTSDYWTLPTVRFSSESPTTRSVAWKRFVCVATCRCSRDDTLTPCRSWVRHNA
jgi:imidazolonepropionase-like amidohydrolase